MQAIGGIYCGFPLPAVGPLVKYRTTVCINLVSQMVAVGFMYFFIIFCGAWRCQYSVDATGFVVQTDKEVMHYCIESGRQKRTSIVYCCKCRSLQYGEGPATLSHFLSLPPSRRGLCSLDTSVCYI